MAARISAVCASGSQHARTALPAAAHVPPASSLSGVGAAPSAECHAAGTGAPRSACQVASASRNCRVARWRASIVWPAMCGVAIHAAARSNGASVFGDYEIRSDAYLKFLVEELKPFIDKRFATRKGRRHTFIAGSSMGGLISLYALCEYPKVFGGAACLSTHWPGIFSMEGNPFPEAMFQYMRQHLPAPRKHRLYFDCGDQTLDALYPPLQQKADAVLRKRGFSARNWQTRFFPGDDHSEKAWSRRLDQPLWFLLGQ